MGPTYKWSGGSNVVSVTVFEIFRVKILTVDLLILVGLTPRPKVTERGDDLLATQIYHRAKFQPNGANGRDIRYQNSCGQTDKQTEQVRQLTRLAYIHTCQSPIADHRETQKVYNTGRHRPCGGMFFTAHTVTPG